MNGYTTSMIRKFGNIDFFYFRSVLWNLIGYLLATLPQIYLDPKLTTHIRYGARYYPYAWIVIPISILVVLASFVVILYVKSRSRGLHIILLPLPFFIGAVCSIFIFLPEKPHGNLMYITIVWYIISILNAYIYKNRVPKDKIVDSETDKEARIEFLRQNITMWRNFILGLLAGFSAVIVTAVIKMHEFNSTYLTDKSEIFLINIYSNIQLSIFVLYFIAETIFSAFDNVSYHANLLLEIKKTE